MCDYSLHSVRSRPAKIGDKLMTKDFGTGTRGFAPVTDASTAVCVLPGTELAFASEVRHADWAIRSLIRGARVKTPHKTAIFRQINKGQERIHRDALDFPDGKVVLLTRLYEGQEATVLQLPAETRVAVEAKKREPVTHDRDPSRLRLSDQRRWAVGGLQIGRPTPINIDCESVVPSRSSLCCMLQRTPPR